MRLLTLTDGSTTKVDDEDYQHLVQFRWRPGGAKSRYVVTGRGRLLHRVVMNAGKGDEADHINRDPRDNQKSNLRFVTHAQNMQNRTGGWGASGLRGVRFRTDKRLSRPYQAIVKVNGQRIYLGYHATAEAAAQAAADGRAKYMTHAPECSQAQ